MRQGFQPLADLGTNDKSRRTFQPLADGRPIPTIPATITKINRLTISPMLDKIWRFLKQLIQRLFGTNPKIEPTPPQPAPTL